MLYKGIQRNKIGNVERKEKKGKGKKNIEHNAR